MSRVADTSLSRLVAQLRRGNDGATDELVRMYLPRLVGLARKTLSGRPQRFTDAEDAVQSALMSFWRRAASGRVSRDLNAESLWGLLAAMTVRKAQQHARRERAQKRGGGRRPLNDAIGDAADGSSSDSAWDGIFGAAPAADFDLLCEEMVTSLDDELQSFVLYRLLGYSTADIADRVGCTQRKVQRKIELVRLQWESEMTAGSR